MLASPVLKIDLHPRAHDLQTCWNEFYFPKISKSLFGLVASSRIVTAFAHQRHAYLEIWPTQQCITPSQIDF